MEKEIPDIYKNMKKHKVFKDGGHESGFGDKLTPEACRENGPCAAGIPTETVEF